MAKYSFFKLRALHQTEIQFRAKTFANESCGNYSFIVHNKSPFCVCMCSIAVEWTRPTPMITLAAHFAIIIVVISSHQIQSSASI